MIEDPGLIAAVVKAIVEENLRWQGFGAGGHNEGRKPTGCAKVYEKDVPRYVSVGIAALRAYETKKG